MTAEQVEEQSADNQAGQSTDDAAQAAQTESAGPSQPDPATASEATSQTPPDDASDQADADADAAVGASGARSLGDAEAMADRADAAVDALVETGDAERAPGAAAQAPDGAVDATESGLDAQADEPAAMSSESIAVDQGAEMTAGAAPADDAAEAPPADDSTQMDTELDAAAVDDVADAPPADDSADMDAELDAAPAHETAADETSAAATAEAADAGLDDAAGTSVDGAEAAPPATPARKAPTGPEPTTMEELLNEQQTEIRSLKHGDVVEGNVVRIDKDEILVDIGAKSEGVVSNRELYGRNTETQPKLNIGDQVLVYVLQPESPEGHAVLSLRRAGLERKWRSMQEQLDAGAIIDAPVIDHNKGGLIVDCGIRGFVPISQIVDFPRRPQNEQPRDAAQEIAEKLQPYVGRKLRLKILEVNRKANRLILSEKVALYEERREKRDELFSSLQVGQKVTGTVRSIAPFGVFIDLGGIDGLVHKSELSWNKVNNPESGYKIGEEVEAEVIDINHERGRISLSIRRLQPDPWHSTVADLKVGDIIDGTVTKIVNFGSFVRVRDGLEGLIHISELSHQRVVHPGDVVHEGQKLKLKVISLDSERHRLGLSLKQAEEEPVAAPRAEREPRERRPRTERGPGYDPSQAVQEPEGGIDNTLAAAFAQVRQQMEETEAARATGDESIGSEPESAAAEPESAAAEPESAAAEPESAAAEPKESEAAAEPEAAAAQAEPAAEAALEPTELAADAGDVANDASTEASAPVAEAGEPADASEGDSADGAPVAADSSAEPAPGEDGSFADKPTKAKSTKARSGKPVADGSGEPAEGARESAPAEGADVDESIGSSATNEG